MKYLKNPLLENKEFAKYFEDIEIEKDPLKVGEDSKKKSSEKKNEEDLKKDKVETPVDKIIEPVDVDINDLVSKCYNSNKK